VDLPYRGGGRFCLGPTDVALPVDDLALQVGLVHRVEVDDAEGPDSGRGEVHQRGRTQPAGTHTQHLGVLEPLLTGHRDIGDDQVTRVAPDFVDGELIRRLDERWQGHGSLPGWVLSSYCCSLVSATAVTWDT